MGALFFQQAYNEGFFPSFLHTTAGYLNALPRLMAGLALLAPTFWGLALFPAAVLLVLWGAIRPEERFLHERFGAAYDDYTRRVRRWL